MTEGEKKQEKGEVKGFAGLSALVSEVDTVPSPSAPKKQPATAAPSAGRPASHSAQPQPSQQRQTYQEPAQPSSGGSSGGKWVLGIAAFISVFWLIGKSDKTATTSSASDYSPPGKSAVHAVPPKVYAYVTTAKVNLRAEADPKSAVLGQVAGMSQIEVIGQSGSWTKVNAPGTPPLEGFVASRFLHTGSYNDAKGIVCDVAGSSRPYSGEVLSQAREGRHSISVSAGNSDAFVKMRSGGKTILAFYVRAYEKGVVRSVPDGTYEIMFASGRDFSRKCLEFVSDMSVMKDPNLNAFQVTSNGYYQYFQTAEYSLVNQHGGNMKPQTISADSFRE